MLTHIKPEVEGYLAETVIETAKEVIKDYGYVYEDEAYCNCAFGAEKLQERLHPIRAFRLEVLVEREFSDTLWAGKNGGPDTVWHWVCFVPDFGLVDVTGAQFAQEPLRVFERAPGHWRKIRHVKDQHDSSREIIRCRDTAWISVPDPKLSHRVVHCLDANFSSTLN